MSSGATTQVSAPKYDSIEALRKITRIVSDITGMLKAQRELLSQRGMALPSGPFENLLKFGKDMESLLEHMSSNRVELQQLEELARTIEIINSTLDLDAVLSGVIDTVIELTGAERGYVVLKNPQTGQLEFRVARKLQQHDLTKDEFIVSRTIIDKCAREGEPFVTINAQEDQNLSESESVVDFMLRSVLCVPLKLKGEVTGVIYTDNRYRQGLFGEREKLLVYAFANQAAIAIENARLFERVRANLAEITQIKEFMDNVFASVGSGIVATDRSNLITAINTAASRILDIAGEESVGQSLWSVLPSLYEGFQRLVEEVRSRRVEQQVEVEPVIGRRGQINLNLKISPFKDTGEVTQGVAIVLDDLTALKQRQAQLSLIRRYLPALDNISAIDQLELGGVEREITVLLADVRDFTTFSETLTPEEVMLVINKYMAVSTGAINSRGGVIDKYMGDAVIGLFNTQLNPQLNHPVRAVSTALAIVDGLKALHQMLPPAQRLFSGVGVHTGMAIMGNVGSPSRKEFTAVGDPPLIAKYLQENALGGEIVISHSTYEQVKDYVTAERIAPRRPKDGEHIGEDVVIYRLISAKLPPLR